MVDVGHGPLAGVRIVELDAAGAVPLAGMLLADLGADVVRIRRHGPDGSTVAPALYRGRTDVSLDLTNVADREKALALIAHADGLIEGFRRNLIEQIGLDPARCLAANPRLVYGRVSGWGLDGPLSGAAGNDINHLAISGALHAIGPGAMPVAPLNLLGESAGGALYLALGMVAGILRAQATGEGQVIDVAQIDGVSSLMTLYYALHSAGRWADSRASNLVDGGAPFYRCYACADGRHVAVGALEPPYFMALCEGLGLMPGRFQQYDRNCWTEMGEVFAEAFAARSRDDWIGIFEGSEACVSPVLSLSEAPQHPHNVARNAFTDLGGSMRPSPAPRFSGTPTEAVPSQAETADAVIDRWA
ncbi:CaiB/BaiF CoA-transferase family protein [Sphingomonas sp. AOB5]|uniref:CaiB/BaiF CoA transferase family protein n=1 Tax=Sphingomonas sp. AOB5 TaxID=3034017 RepID=UPI0023F82233|nr:CaiB/BaiF CoA-transferase family protein [Sphingomonas sp. AOB5]MDF7777498.1 CaiB/BaiF CoA-transferase family protein [Sphingomonas sp. AOB5]